MQAGRIGRTRCRPGGTPPRLADAGGNVRPTTGLQNAQPRAVPPAGADDEEVHYFFIKRPVFAIVISLIITLLGRVRDPAAADLALSADHAAGSPGSGVLPRRHRGGRGGGGGRADRGSSSPGLQGMLYYSSANSSDGTMSLQIYFDVYRSQDLAAVDVQNAVKLAEPQLPDAVRQNGITILKANTDILGVVALTSDDPRYDAAYLTNYLKLYVEDEIKRLPGRRQRADLRRLEFSMLIQLDPERMAQLGITASDVAAAVREQNATNPAGPTGARARSAGHRAHAAGDHAGPAQDSGGVRRHRGPGQGGWVHRPHPRHRQGRPGLAQLRPRRPAQRQPAATDAALPPPGRQRARRQGGGGQADGRAAAQLPAGRALQDPVRHHAVRHRLHQGSGEDAGRGDGAGDPGGVPLPAELARHADPDARGAGERHRHVSRAC